MIRAHYGIKRAQKQIIVRDNQMSRTQNQMI